MPHHVWTLHITDMIAMCRTICGPYCRLGSQPVTPQVCGMSLLAAIKYVAGIKVCCDHAHGQLPQRCCCHCQPAAAEPLLNSSVPPFIHRHCRPLPRHRPVTGMARALPRLPNNWHIALRERQGSGGGGLPVLACRRERDSGSDESTTTTGLESNMPYNQKPESRSGMPGC